MFEEKIEIKENNTKKITKKKVYAHMSCQNLVKKIVH